MICVSFEDQACLCRPCRVQVINRKATWVFTNETSWRMSTRKRIHEVIVNTVATTRFVGFVGFAWDIFLWKVIDSTEGLSECFRPISGMEIFQRGSVGAVSYKCTDDNKYRARRAVKSNRLRLWALYNQQPPVVRLHPFRYNLLTFPCIKTYFDSITWMKIFTYEFLS